MKDKATIPVITTEQVLCCLSNEWQTIDRIIVRLKINFPDLQKVAFMKLNQQIKFNQQVKLRLEELEHLGKVIVDIKRIEVRLGFGVAPSKRNWDSLPARAPTLQAFFDRAEHVSAQPHWHRRRTVRHPYVPLSWLPRSSPGTYF